MLVFPLIVLDMCLFIPLASMFLPNFTGLLNNWKTMRTSNFPKVVRGILMVWLGSKAGRSITSALHYSFMWCVVVVDMLSCGYSLPSFHSRVATTSSRSETEMHQRIHMICKHLCISGVSINEEVVTFHPSSV